MIYKCDYCKREFDKSGALKAHVKATGHTFKKYINDVLLKGNKS